MRLSHRQKDLALTYGVLIVLSLIVIVACIGLSGCGSWGGIDVKIRPGGKQPDEQPKPPPPKDDWAPPWFRRQPKGLAIFASLQPISDTVSHPDTLPTGKSDGQSEEKSEDKPTEVVDEPEEHPATENDKDTEAGRLFGKCRNCNCCNKCVCSGVESQPTHRQRPGILYELISVAWGYFTLPLTIVEGIQSLAFFGGIALFAYLFARLFIAGR